MSKGLGCLAAVVVVVIILAVIAGGSYNRLVGLSQAVDAQWAQVESVYQRRADLIPNLVATVQGAANFEKSTLEAVTQGPGQRRPGRAAQRRERPQRSRRLRALPGRPGSALGRPVPPAGGGGGLSRPEGDPELPRPPGPARRDGEPDLRRADALQRDRPRLQHGAPAVPDRPVRRAARLPREGLFQGPAGRGHRAQGGVRVLARARLARRDRRRRCLRRRARGLRTAA